jgi:hypothetical protein
MDKLKSTVYVYGWINCPVCFHQIWCTKTTGKGIPDFSFEGRYVYREKICPECRERYKLGMVQFYSKDSTDCPAGNLMVMEET